MSKGNGQKQSLDNQIIKLRCTAHGITVSTFHSNSYVRFIQALKKSPLISKDQQTEEVFTGSGDSHDSDETHQTASEMSEIAEVTTEQTRKKTLRGNSQRRKTKVRAKRRKGKKSPKKRRPKTAGSALKGVNHSHLTPRGPPGKWTPRQMDPQANGPPGK